jgi:hypothetical protein
MWAFEPYGRAAGSDAGDSGRDFTSIGVREIRQRLLLRERRDAGAADPTSAAGELKAAIGSRRHPGSSLRP